MSEAALAMATYREALASGRALASCAASHRSRRLGGPPINREGWAQCLAWLSKLAALSDPCAQLVSAIGLPPLYQTAGEAAANVYERACSAMSKEYDDVIGRAMPDAYGPPRMYRRAWSIRERIIVQAYLRRATDAWSDSVGCYGWALEQVAQEEGVILPAWPGAAS